VLAGPLGAAAARRHVICSSRSSGQHPGSDTIAECACVGYTSREHGSGGETDPELRLFFPTFIKLVRTAAADFGEGFSEVVG
jgi:hypothetical protein